MIGMIRAFLHPGKVATSDPRSTSIRAEAVWTPKGYVTASPEESDTQTVPEHDQNSRLPGRAGMGSTETSPPGTGYSQGRTYE